MKALVASQRTRLVKSRLPSVQALVVFFGIALAVPIGYAAWLGYREHQASRELESLIAPIRAAGLPLGDAWMEKRFREMASSQGTAAWSRILLLSSSFGWGAQEKLPILGSGEPLRMLEPGAQWKSKAQVKDYLAEAQPLLDMIHQARVYPMPVWQPMEFRGEGTLLPELQESRNVGRLLQLEFEDAVMENDPDRALRALSSMKTTAEAFDWDLWIVAELIQITLRGQHYESLQRSLVSNVWTLEHMETLIEQVRQPMNVAQSWHDSLDSQQAMLLSFISGSQQLPVIPNELARSASSQLAMVQEYRELQALAATPVGQLAEAVGQVQSRWAALAAQNSDSLLRDQYMIAGQAYASAFERDERSRRLVLTSLAVKKFHLLHQRWPNQLQELSQVGLVPADWTLPGIGSLGYAIEPDGKTACVWSVSENQGSVFEQNQIPSGKRIVESTCPDYAGEKLAQVQYYLTVIK